MTRLEKIGEELKNIRLSKKIKLKTLSGKTGISKKQLIELEKGSRNYGIMTYLKYVDALKYVAEHIK